MFFKNYQLRSETYQCKHVIGIYIANIQIVDYNDRKREAVMYKRILLEIKKHLEQRGEVTKEQRDYAQVELEQMEKMYPLITYYEEKRLSHLRTLNSYIGNQDMKTILMDQAISLSNIKSSYHKMCVIICRE